MRNHRCGFAIAAQRAARELARAKEEWLGKSRGLYCSDKAKGLFAGTEAEWKTYDNRDRTTKATWSRRCPFTELQLKKMGWQNRVSDRMKARKAFKKGQTVRINFKDNYGPNHWKHRFTGQTGTVVRSGNKGGLVVEIPFTKELNNHNDPRRDWDQGWGTGSAAFTMIVPDPAGIWMDPQELEAV
jgi:ribosomal protein L21E